LQAPATNLFNQLRFRLQAIRSYGKQLLNHLPMCGTLLFAHSLCVDVHVRGDVGCRNNSCRTFTSVWLARSRQEYECLNVCQPTALRKPARFAAGWMTRFSGICSVAQDNQG
jgi:hypothetical protein